VAKEGGKGPKAGRAQIERMERVIESVEIGTKASSGGG